MNHALKTQPKRDIEYPDFDGEPMADNSEQADWMTLLYDHLRQLFPDQCVAMNLLWYPIRGDNKTRLAPDVFVAFGRPRHYRGSYKQWEEADQPPQVVIELWSPRNTLREQTSKKASYERLGVEEFITFDLVRRTLAVWERGPRGFQRVDTDDRWVSTRLGLTFLRQGQELIILGPDGHPLQSLAEVLRGQAEARDQAEQARDQAEQARDQAEQARREVEQAQMAHMKAEAEAAQRLAQAEREIAELRAALAAKA